MKEMISKPEKKKPGPKPADPERPRRLRETVAVSQADLDDIDSVRGELSRSSWIYAQVRRALRYLGE